MKGKPRQLAKEQTSRRRSLQCSARFRQPSTFFLFQFLKIPRLWFSTRTIKMIDKLIGDRLWAVNRNSYFKTRQNAEMVVMVEIGDGWKQTRTRGVMERRRERKMRICVEPKSRPADIVNCHSGCRQTSETDIISPYYLPLQELSSTQPLLSSFSFHLWSHFQVIFFFIPPVHMHEYEPPDLVLSIFLLSLLLHFLQVRPFFPPPLKWVGLQNALPCPCSMVRCFSVGGRRVFGLFPLFYQFTSVILYSGTMSSHSSHRILLGSQRDSGSP